MAYFITNSDTKNLGDRLRELIKESEELKFLVGFFYFTGIRELYEALKSNPNVILKILVGLEVDKMVYGLVEYENIEKLSEDQKLNRYLESLKKAINSQEFDNKDFYEQVEFFIKMLEEKRLIIKKTYNPNHAKLYIFKLKNNIVRPAVFITGSSNLTRAGLISQEEFNIEISDFGVEKVKDYFDKFVKDAKDYFDKLAKDVKDYFDKLVKDAEGYFDKLWEDAVEITENNERKTKLIETLTKGTFLRKITPYEAYAFVLKNYLDTYKSENISAEEVLKNSGYTPYKYQVDAIKQALSIIKENNGVILGDVVGLGKTVIACAIAFLLNKKGIVIAPPGLIGDEYDTEGWKKYIKDFSLDKLGWKALSLGKLEDVLEYVKENTNIEVVIVDEAHRFRNQNTKGYELLKNICRGKIVILLTATPFNNKPSDIFSLLKLFIVPKKSTITFWDNLEQMFNEYQNTFEKLSYIIKHHNSEDYTKIKKVKYYYKSIFKEDKVDISKVKDEAHEVAQKIKSIIEPIIIRRNRLDLQENPDYRKEVEKLSKVEDPKECFFELTKEQSEFYDKVINQYFAHPQDGGQFKGAIYMPFAYKVGLAKFMKNEDLGENDTSLGKNDTSKEDRFQYQQQFNLYEFMRRLLVKRFESSFYSFKQSIENFKNITEKARSFIKRTNKYILDRRLLEKIYDEDLEEIEEKLMEYSKALEAKGEDSKYHEVYDLSKFKDKDRFIEDIESDIKLFDCILKELKNLKLVKNENEKEDESENDPKINKLIQGLKENFKKEPNRKVIIFSEYRDTVKYLEKRLTKEFNNRVLSVAGDLTKGKIEQIYKNFDASYKEQENSYDILITTDKLSEGFNLNRAGMVINYDIPWNPVRVIQRVGRINRIGKKVFDSLYIVNFFPTEKGANYVKSKQIAESKMFFIHNVLGEDAKIFSLDEEPIPSKLYERISENPEKLEIAKNKIFFIYKALGEDAKIFDVYEEPTPSKLYERILENPEKLEEESFYTKVLKEFKEIENKDPSLIETLDNLPTRIKVAKKSDKNELFVVIRKGRSIHILYTDYKNKPEVKSLEEVIDRIRSSPDEKSLELSKHFWQTYESILKEQIQKPQGYSDNSLEGKAFNNLKSLLNHESFKPYASFISTLIEDILYYGTLSEHTLRRITQIKGDSKDIKEIEKGIKEIENLIKELGENYLEKEKKRLKYVVKDIIISIENQGE